MGREGFGTREEMGLAVKLSDFQSILTSSFIVSSQPFLSCMQSRSQGWVSTEKITRWETKRQGSADSVPGSGKSLPLTGSLFPHLENERTG